MALENKKSLLQPSSIESQQFRLQFSNLAPTGVVPGTTPAGTSAPVTRTGGLAAPANPAPAASLFVQAPAPVSLAAPPVIPPVVPAPVVVEAPGAVEIPLTYVTEALYFDGNTYYSSSLDTDLDLSIRNSYPESIGIGFFFKDVTGGRRTLFHTYSGSSEVSQSFEIYAQGGYIYYESQHSGSKIAHRVSTNAGNLSGTAGNGYSFVYTRLTGYIPTFVSFCGLKVDVLSNPSSGNGGPYRGTGYALTFSEFDTVTNSEYNTSNNTHYYVGGSPARPSNWDGSVATLFFVSASSGLSNMLTTAKWAGNQAQVEDATNLFRMYSFKNTLNDITGSTAEFQLPLELVEGTTTYAQGPFLT